MLVLNSQYYHWYTASLFNSIDKLNHIYLITAKRASTTVYYLKINQIDNQTTNAYY